MGKFVCNFISYALKRTVDITAVSYTHLVAPEPHIWGIGGTPLDVGVQKGLV